jgi:type IX secretion system PorP/SprF family membrane protein
MLVLEYSLYRSQIMNRFFTCCAFLLMLLADVAAQDPQLTQFYASPLYTNPAMAGASRKIRFTLNARDQYTALNNNYQTAVVGFDAYLPKIKSGFGIVSMYDVAGDGGLTSTSVNAIYSYNLELNREWAVNMALQGGVLQRRYDFSRFVFRDMIDPTQGPVLPTAEAKGLEQIMVPNIGVGGLLYSSRMFFGAAIHNVLEPNMSFYTPDLDNVALILPRRFTGHAGLNIYLNKARFEENRVILSPNILVMQQRNFFQMNMGCYLKQKSLTIGAWYRQTSTNGDAFIFMMGLKFPSVRVGYSYDAIISSAKTATIGSHEISLGFEIKTKNRTGTRYNKKLVCPAL